MIHHPLRDGNQYGVNINAHYSGVLLQLDDGSDGNFVRVRLDKEEAEALIERLKSSAAKIRE